MKMEDVIATIFPSMSTEEYIPFNAPLSKHNPHEKAGTFLRSYLPLEGFLFVENIHQ